ncbi:MAG: hypothetical protein B6I31_02835 [Desulfobacteraceae bacterium 4572_19]|nr:MAG: hypothetical protein B6I31_02835 [Desulfobacteraceae bacterium 4572_19]
MEINFTPYFTRYEALSQKVDQAFNQVKNEHKECVKCVQGCSDCCHALFDLTLIEAIYINHKFNQNCEGLEKLKILDAANMADRKIHRLKKAAYAEFKKDKNEVKVLGKMAQERVRCPFLNEKDMCAMYEDRPLTCRLYGIPTSSGGISHTCGKTGFTQGDKYPTVNMDILYKQMYIISEELVQDIKSKHTKMADMIVPLSMAILVEYSSEYMGIDNNNDNKK